MKFNINTNMWIHHPKLAEAKSLSVIRLWDNSISTALMFWVNGGFFYPIQYHEYDWDGDFRL